MLLWQDYAAANIQNIIAGAQYRNQLLCCFDTLFCAHKTAAGMVVVMAVATADHGKIMLSGIVAGKYDSGVRTRMGVKYFNPVQILGVCRDHLISEWMSLV